MGDAGGRLEETGTDTHVIVVGGGVSGCACAGWLASHRVPTTLVSAALDVVGMPGYGPVVAAPSVGGWTRLEASLDEMPAALRCAWLSGARLAAEGASGHETDTGALRGLVVDPRGVSLRVKWVLEQLPSLELRQGLVTRVGPVPGRRLWEVETAFGDVLQAEVVVLAVGLALGGRLSVGLQTGAGGRYGEVAADELLSCLEEQGLRTRGAVAYVSPTYSTGDESGDSGESSAGAPCRWVEEVREWEAHWIQEAEGGGRGPASLLGFGLEAALNGGRGLTLMELRPFERGGVAEPAVVPAGLCTGEWQAYDSGSQVGGEGCAGDAAGRVSRCSYEVRARVIQGVDGEGRVGGHASLWAIGRVAGASSYVESMESGLRAAAAVAAAARSPRSWVGARPGPTQTGWVHSERRGEE